MSALTQASNSKPTKLFADVRLATITYHVGSKASSRDLRRNDTRSQVSISRTSSRHRKSTTTQRNRATIKRWTTLENHEVEIWQEFLAIEILNLVQTSDGSHFLLIYYLARFSKGELRRTFSQSERSVYTWLPGWPIMSSLVFKSVNWRSGSRSAKWRAPPQQAVRKTLKGGCRYKSDKKGLRFLFIVNKARKLPSLSVRSFSKKRRIS